MNSFELDIFSMFSQASIVVQAVMIILVLASLSSWWIIFERWMTLSRAKKDIFSFEKFFWSEKKIRYFISRYFQKKNKIGLEQIFFVGFDEYQKSNSLENSKKAMEITISRHEEQLDNRLSFLSTVASASPFIGLFGTVWGNNERIRGLVSVNTSFDYSSSSWNFRSAGCNCFRFIYRDTSINII